MKTLLLSDIDRNNKGNIPYGLKLVQDIGFEVKVIHIIDTRNKQGIYSAYSDSKTLSPEVESYDELLNKEVVQSKDFLSKHVGRESSVLEHPLTVDFEVKTGHLDEVLIEETNQPQYSLLMISARPQGEPWTTTDDIFHIIVLSNNPVLLTPYNAGYKKPKRAIIVTEGKEHEADHLREADKLLKKLGMTFCALNVNGNEEYETEIKNNKAWEDIQQKIDSYFTIDDKNAEAIHKAANSYEADLIILFEQKRNILKRLFGKSMTEKLASITKLPLLVFYK